jgi:hypothetical protein
VAFHDSVVQRLEPMLVNIPLGVSAVTKRVKVKVTNADIGPPAERPGHVIMLMANDGDCPAGTVIGMPDFDRTAPGAQNTVEVAGGKSRAAMVTLNVSSGAFTSFNRRAPKRCTLTFSASAVVAGNSDPAPSNNVAILELSVIDGNDPDGMGVHETTASSIRPMKVRLGKGRASLLRRATVTVGNADVLDVAGHAVTLVAADGDCPPGTVGVPDFDSATAGPQNVVAVPAMRTRTGRLPVTINASAFTTRNIKSPARCTADLVATGPAGDSEGSNNLSRLVIDVYDRNDF